MVMRGGNEPLAKGEPNEQTYFRLSVKRGSHLGSPDTGCICSGPGRQQDLYLEGKIQQEASQQEIHRGR